MSTEKKDHIAGIYNYCDRWCEKCKFTSRCLLFTNESRFNTYEILNNGKKPDPEEIYRDYFDKMRDEIDDDDRDWFDLDDEDGEDFELDSAQEELEEKKLPLEELSDEYFKASFEFVKAVRAQYEFSEHRNRVLADPALMEIYNEFEIVEWYCSFIGAKIARACGSKKELMLEDDEEMREIISYDMNGSAKICDIAVKRSIQSLNALYKLIPEFEDRIEFLLVMIGKILNGVETEFPDFADFKRPGFDTGEL